MPDYIEAASRCGERENGLDALGRLVERTQIASTDWALGVEARSSALLTEDGSVAEQLYRQAVEHLELTGARPDLGRAHLVFGEWLRREGRRQDAREQLHSSLDIFISIGAPAFAGRARLELAATGETPRKRTDESRPDLTPQEVHIARLAREGLTNPEIGGQLFISPRTVEWHLRHIYGKLGVASRKELRTVEIHFT